MNCLRLTPFAFIALFILFPETALAQGEAPETALQGLELIALALGGLGASIAGLVGSVLTDLFKGIPFLSSDQKGRTEKFILELLAGLLSVGTAWIITQATPIAEWLDSSGTWAMIAMAWPWARGFYIQRKRARQVAG